MEVITLSVLLALCVVTLGVACIVLAKGYGRTDAGLLAALNKMTDRVVVDHKDQLERQRQENELELGMDYNKTQRERARFRGTEPSENGTVVRPSIVVGDDPT